ncbi:MAG TPA: hypothetical protein VKV25_07180 [Acidimicrobiales bacterium]|nr:hypothetical protein [Acidimicrobiales bacterium]
MSPAGPADGRCASPYNCKTAVGGPGHWCGPCQARALTSDRLGDVLHLAQAPNLLYHERLAAHPEPLVRAMLYERPDLFPQIRLALALDRDPMLRTLAAGSASTPPQALRRLLYDDDPELLFVLASNRRLGAAGLRLLTRHPDPAIAERARDTLLDLAAARLGHERRVPEGLSASPFHRPPAGPGTATWSPDTATG